jgi:hypothetical protein
MGLLDDAIREHLELKRRHGAPDDELERAEQEALGPARREAAAGVGVPPVEEVPGEDVAADIPPPPPPPPVDDPVYADEYAEEPAPADYDEPDPQPGVPEPIPFEPVDELPELEEAPPPGTAKPHGDPAIGDYEEPVVDVEETVLDPEDPVAEPPPPPPAEPPDRARTSILDDPLAEGEPDDGEDVLEETPEFLQDTPEHDKLWFEQKPPRDFDFE